MQWVRDKGLIPVASLAGVKGWIDTAPQPPQTAIQSPTDRQLPEGGLTVLECRPRLADHSATATVTWLRNSVPITEQDPRHQRLNEWSLLVRNFSLSGEEKVVQYSCIVGVVMGSRDLYYQKEVNRSFHLSLTEGEP